ncbi:MAG TPA: rhomboid family intramembrane serine protease, partial [Acidimicrobiia bacterium]|nr:rhomboid family intramembrane serine protease [Acidimicrobiia bacterium]
MVIPIRDDLPTTSKPVLTIAIIAACIYIYAFVQPRQPDQQVQFLAQHAAIPCEVVHAKPISNELSQECDGQLQIPGLPPSSPAEPFPHKNVFLAIVVSMFLHGSWLHVLGNMLFLWIFGNNIEDRLGPVGYAVFYLVAGVVAAITH